MLFACTKLNDLEIAHDDEHVDALAKLEARLFVADIGQNIVEEILLLNKGDGTIRVVTP